MRNIRFSISKYEHNETGGKIVCMWSKVSDLPWDWKVYAKWETTQYKDDFLNTSTAAFITDCVVENKF